MITILTSIAKAKNCNYFNKYCEQSTQNLMNDLIYKYDYFLLQSMICVNKIYKYIITII